MSKIIKPTDDNFYEYINKKFTKYKILKNKKTIEEICFPKTFEFQIPQLFLSEIINPATNYKGILVYHRIGAGKTCTAIRIAENFKGIKRIVIVLPASLINNFRSELRSPCAGSNYLTERERDLLKKYHPTSLEFKAIIDKSNVRIDKYYNIYSYNKFIDAIKKNIFSFDNALVIIDEVHNMISETGTYYETFHAAIHSAPDNMRLVLMSATPIFDKPTEIALTMNLLLRDKQMPTKDKFVETFIDITYKKKEIILTAKNLDLFKQYVRGYVSYYKGAPPHVFPRSEIFLVKTKMSDKQQILYKKIIKRVENVEDISNSFLIGTRMVSNITYPNGKTGLAGYRSLRDSDLTLDKIKEYSPKFLKIFRKIKKCKGTVFVYSNFKEYGGIKPFTRFLEQNGYKDYETEGEGKKRFAVWSGDQDPSLKDEIKTIFNNKNNEKGDHIKIICASPSAKEGVSFLRVKQVHIMEPYWNMSRIHQIIGRAIRFCSHKDVPLEDQMVEVYIYLAVHPKIKRSVDERIMKIAVAKEIVNKQFEHALKEAAIDCQLFKNANVYPGEDPIVCER